VYSIPAKQWCALIASNRLRRNVTSLWPRTKLMCGTEWMNASGSGIAPLRTRDAHSCRERSNWVLTFSARLMSTLPSERCGV
jgi:hypothetical protein